MMTCLRWIGLLVSVASWLPASAAGPGPIVVIPLQTDVSRAQFYFLRRALKQAESEGARAVVIEMATNGGEVSAALDEMDALLKTRLPTFTYINPRALSAGALIALATGEIYMAPGAVIGAAAPVLSGGEDLPKTMSDKTVSALSAMARAAAEKNGHRPELAEAFIRKEQEVKIGDVVIDRADSLLTLTAPEAVKMYDDRPLLASGVADSLPQMLALAGLTGAVETLAPTGFERLAIWITQLAPLFLLGGLLGAYIEFKTPGFGLPGLLSALCFFIFFTGHYLAGLAGWEVSLLFALGLLLVLGELLLHPGTVIPGVLGLLLMFGSILWAMIDRYPGEPILPTTPMLLRPVFNLSAALGLAIFLGWWLAKFLPRTSFYHHIVLAETIPSPSHHIPLGAGRVAVGERGIAHTLLRPSGKAEVGGHLLDVVTPGDLIEAGSAIEVVAVDGMRVVVARPAVNA